MSVNHAEVTAFVKAIAAPMMKHLRKVHNVRKFSPSIRCDYSRRRKTSWGGVDENGKPRISLALLKFCKEGDAVTLNEYDHIKKDPEIGAFTGDWKCAIGALVAHELAHAMQYTKYNKVMLMAGALTGSLSTWPSTDIKEHGKLWQAVYRDLRVTFVNGGKTKAVKYVVPATPAPCTTPLTPKRKLNKPYFTLEFNRNGGRHAMYYLTGSRKLIGALFKKETGKVQVMLPGETKYKWTTFRSNIEARKALIEPLIPKMLNADKAH